jgi:hypothetical protein
VWNGLGWNNTIGALEKYEPDKDTAPQQLVSGDLAPGTPSVNLDASGHAQIVWKQMYERRVVTLQVSDDTWYQVHYDGSSTSGNLSRGNDTSLEVYAEGTDPKSYIDISLTKLSQIF